MPYDAAKDPLAGYDPKGPRSFGAKGRAVTPSNTVDLDPYAKAVVVTVAGDLTILPAKNADDATLTFEDCPVGFVPPFRVRRVLATGTTASVATIDV
jgi:hypothetical protein